MEYTSLRKHNFLSFFSIIKLPSTSFTLFMILCRWWKWQPWISTSGKTSDRAAHMAIKNKKKIDVIMLHVLTPIHCVRFIVLIITRYTLNNQSYYYIEPKIICLELTFFKVKIANLNCRFSDQLYYLSQNLKWQRLFGFSLIYRQKFFVPLHLTMVIWYDLILHICVVVKVIISDSNVYSIPKTPDIPYC